MSRNARKRAGRGGAGKLFLLLLIFGLGAAAFYYMKEQNTETAAENADPFPGMMVEKAFRGDIAVTTEGSGSIEAASRKAVTLEYDGRLEEIYVETGDQVCKGDRLAVYDREALDTVIETKTKELDSLNLSISQSNMYGNYYISSPVPGYVKRVFASAGDSVAEVTKRCGGIAELSADQKLKVEFSIGESGLKLGDSVLVSFDTFLVAGVVEKAENGSAAVTIPDHPEYQVDSRAVVYTPSWEYLGEGSLRSNQPYLVQADEGVISYVWVNTHMMVYAGSVLFVYENPVFGSDYLELLSNREELTEEIRELEAYRENPVVVSEYDGYIVTLDAMEGMSYQKEKQFCTIADSSTLNLKVDIDELDIDGVEIGERAEVVFDAFEDQPFQGRVEKISGVGRNVGGVTTYTVTIALSGDRRLRDAMSATASIVLQEKKQVLLVPAEAVTAEGALRYVQVVQDGALVQTEVQTGLVNEDYAEITGGITEGTEIAVPKTAAEDTFLLMMEESQRLREEQSDSAA